MCMGGEKKGSPEQFGFEPLKLSSHCLVFLFHPLRESDVVSHD